MDYYRILGVERTASDDDIKRAYRRLASQHHPDKGGDKERFQEIQQAYATLSDPGRRAEYDNPRPQHSPFGGFAHSGFNINDIFGQMFGSGGGFQNPRRGHVRMTLWISLRDVMTGGKRTVSIGTTQGVQGVEIEIPLGIDDGDAVQYQGLGPGGSDLVVEYRQHPAPDWQRQGLNLITERKILIWDLILGGDVQITDPLGNQLLTIIPPNTQSGTVLRLRSRGIRNQRGEQGDVLVRVQANIPQIIPPELRDAIQKYGR